MGFQILLEGLVNVFQPINLMWIVIGAFLGTVVGIIPGFGSATAIAILIPLVFGLEPLSALILMAAVYYGAMYGGSRAAILLNTPGDAGAIATTFDLYSMEIGSVHV